MSEQPSAFFWEIAEPFLAKDGISKGTMMGFPCLRVNGAFFASSDRESGDLIVKLPASRVQELIDAEFGHPFAPAGRRFREWVVVPDRDPERWQQMIAEALAFVK